MEILQKIRRFFHRRRRREDVFSYHDGHALRRIDPLQALLDLEKHYPQNALLKDDCFAAERNDTEAILRLTKAVQDVFAVKQYDGASQAGLTLAQQLNLLTLFLTYLAEIKKKLAPSPTS